MARWPQKGIPAAIHLSAAFLLSACTGIQPPLAPPSPATLAAVQAAAPHPCNATTAATLDAYRIPPAQIRSIYYDTRRTGRERSILQSYDAWISLADQHSELVVRHNPDCRLLNVHTRGGTGIADIPGLLVRHAPLQARPGRPLPGPWEKRSRSQHAIAPAQATCSSGRRAGALSDPRQ